MYFPKFFSQLLNDLNQMIRHLNSSCELLNRLCSQQRTILPMIKNFHNSKTTRRVPELFIRSGFLLASLHYEYKNTERALECLNIIKYETDKYQKWNLKMKIYMKMSEVASLMGKSQLSLIYAQKSLELAWSEEDIKWEMLSYDMMGKCYYNLGKIDQAHYFHRKVSHKLPKYLKSNFLVYGWRR